MNRLKDIIIAITIFVALAICLSLMKLKPSSNSVETQNEKEKVFYMIRSEAYPSMEGGVNIVLDYSCDGLVQTQAVFETTEERDAYIKHLELIGKVFNKGGIE